MTRPIITRTVPLLDFEVQRNGDGRTVTAYAATFGNQYPVVDQHGDYDEMLNRSVFNGVLARPGSIERVGVFANHGTTIHGTPSERYSEPIGTPLEIKADGRGLLTRTRYAKTPLGDTMLQLWIEEVIRGQSFSGPILAPDRIKRSAGRTLVERMALGLTEYGPALLAPMNPEATLVAIRSQLLDRPWRELTPEERRELIALEETPDHLEVHEATTTQPPEGPAESPVAPPDSGLSIEVIAAAQAQRRRHNN